MRYFISDNGKEFVNRYTLFRIEPIKINNDTVGQLVKYYGIFGWSISLDKSIADIEKLRKISEPVANRIKKYIQQ